MMTVTYFYIKGTLQLEWQEAVMGRVHVRPGEWFLVGDWSSGAGDG